MSHKLLGLMVTVVAALAPLAAHADDVSNGRNVEAARPIVERMRDGVILREQGDASWMAGKDGFVAGATVATSDLAPYLCIGEVVSAMADGSLLEARADVVQAAAISDAQALARQIGPAATSQALDVAEAQLSLDLGERIAAAK